MAWRMERRVPLTLVFTLMVQMVMLVAWATQLDARVGNLENAGAETRNIMAQLARLEERIDAVRGDIADLRQRLERRPAR